MSASNNTEKRQAIYGVVGIQPDADAQAILISNTIIRGGYLGNSDKEVLITARAAEKLNIDFGGELILSSGATSMKVTVAGIIDDEQLANLKDINNEGFIPKKLVWVEGDPPTIYASPCSPEEVVVADWRIAKGLFKLVALSRVNAKVLNPENAYDVARQLALERDLWVWSSYGGQITRIGMEERMEAKGASVTVPWIIIVLNVILAVWNAVFERKREIAILSSIGLNPTHVAGIFMAEGSIIGFIGGGVGYVLGLVGYRLLSALSVAIEVYQKVSAFWCLASLGIALAAVLVGTGIALKYSIILTPSLMRSWAKGEKVDYMGETFEFKLPFRVHSSEIDALFSYIKTRVQEHVIRVHNTVNPVLVKKFTKESEKEDASSQTRIIVFNYIFGRTDPIGSIPFTLVAERRKEEENYALRLVFRGGERSVVEENVTFIRMLIIGWSTQSK
jgi:hypothetical protein